MSVNNFHEIMALTQTIAETTGCTLEQAFTTLLTLHNSNGSVVIRGKEYRNDPIPEVILAYVDARAIGTELTVKDAYRLTGQGLPPPRAKGLSHYLQTHGWERTRTRVDNLSLYKKIHHALSVDKEN